jgi:hypothetical protein
MYKLFPPDFLVPHLPQGHCGQERDGGASAQYVPLVSVAIAKRLAAAPATIQIGTKKSTTSGTYPLPVPPNSPNDHWSYDFEPPGGVVVDFGGGFGCSCLASFPLVSLASFWGSVFASFPFCLEPGSKYFSNPLGGFSQKTLHWFSTVRNVELFCKCGGDKRLRRLCTHFVILCLRYGCIVLGF